MKIEIFPTARARIKEIRRYSQKLWGKEQANKYIRGLGKNLFIISTMPCCKWRLSALRCSRTKRTLRCGARKSPFSLAAQRDYEQVSKAIDKPPAQRSLWRPVEDEVLKGVFFIRYKQHYIFFRELKKHGIGVISVLHKNMDIPPRLKEGGNAPS